MEEKIIKFVNLLRRAGVPVSPGETLDAIKGLRLAGQDRDIFQNTLRCSLIKNEAHHKIYNKLFNHYFRADFPFHYFEEGQPEEGQQAVINGVPVKFLSIDGGDEGIPGMGIAPGGRTGRPIGDMGQTVAQLVRLGNTQAFRELAREAVGRLKAISEQEACDLRVLERRVKVYLEWKIAEDILEKESCEKSGSLSQLASLVTFEGILEEELERYLLNHFPDSAMDALLQRENIKELDFYELSENQVQVMKRILSKLGRKLASRLSYRLANSKRGYIDLRSTLRKSMATGGIPVRPGYRTRRYDRPEFVVFCDISGSVARFSEFMLQLVYSVQQKYLKVRSFVFVDSLDEITALFQDREIEDALKKMYNKTTSSKTAFSNYGNLWEETERMLLPEFTNKTTLLILGDARNNYHRDNRHIIERISSRVKNIIWLNPEPAERWNKEDSLMGLYGTHCHQVFECRNLTQLEWAVREIL